MSVSPTLSFTHRHAIKALIQPLHKSVTNFGSLTVAILMNNGRMAAICTNPKVIISALKDDTRLDDGIFSYDYLKKHKVMYAEQYIEAQTSVLSLNQAFLNEELYLGYTYAKSCSDCKIMITYHSAKPVEEGSVCYKNTIQHLEKFIPQFIEQTIQFFIQKIPELSFTRFGSDQRYRHLALTSELPSEQDRVQKLNNVDKTILYWNAQGKNSEEIGIILSLSKNTIDSYRRKIISKLNVNSVTQAVYLAMKHSAIA